jgi:hypothetical protein
MSVPMMVARPLLHDQRGLLAWGRPFFSAGDEPWTSTAKFMLGWTLRKPGTRWRWLTASARARPDDTEHEPFELWVIESVTVRLRPNHAIDAMLATSEERTLSQSWAPKYRNDLYVCVTLRTTAVSHRLLEEPSRG